MSHKQRSRGRSAGIAVVLVGAGVALGFTADEVSSTVAPAYPGSPTATVFVSAMPVSAVTVRATETTTQTVYTSGPGGYGDGTFKVGTDIPAGVYKTKGPANGNGVCFWQIIGGSSDDPTTTSGTPRGPATITVEQNDRAVKLQGCQPFIKV